MSYILCLANEGRREPSTQVKLLNKREKEIKEANEEIGQGRRKDWFVGERVSPDKKNFW